MLDKRNYRISTVRSGAREREMCLQCRKRVGEKEWQILLIFTSKKVVKSSGRRVNEEEGGTPMI